MTIRACRVAILVAATCSLPNCAPAGSASPGTQARATGFSVRTTPAGATIETSGQFRCTSPCEVPLQGGAFVATVTLLGYKPVQIPVAAGTNPGVVNVKLVPQDPGAGAPNPVASH